MLAQLKDYIEWRLKCAKEHGDAKTCFDQVYGAVSMLTILHPELEKQAGELYAEYAIEFYYLCYGIKKEKEDWL